MEGDEYRQSETRQCLVLLIYMQVGWSKVKSSMIKHGHPCVIVPKMFQFFNFDLNLNIFMIIMWKAIELRLLCGMTIESCYVIRHSSPMSSTHLENLHEDVNGECGLIEAIGAAFFTTIWQPFCRPDPPWG